MKLILQIALRNAILNWRHSVGALLSIGIAFYTINVFNGYIADMERMYQDGYRNRSMYGNFIIENQNMDTPEGRAEAWKHRLTEEQQAALQKFFDEHRDQIVATPRFLIGTGMASSGSVQTIFIANGTDTEQGEKVRGPAWAWNAAAGVPLEKTTELQPILLAKGLGRLLGCETSVSVRDILQINGGYKPGERPYECQSSSVQLSVTTDSGQVNAMDFNVVGLGDAGYADIDKRYLWIPLHLAQQLYNTKEISFQTVLLTDDVKPSQFHKEFDKDIRSKYPDLKMTAWELHRAGEFYQKTISLLNIFKYFVIVVMIVMSALSIYNIVSKIVSERTREIGTLLSVGYPRQKVLALFMWEISFLTIGGSLMGLVLSLITSRSIDQARIFYKAGILSDPVPFRILLTSDQVILSLLFLINVSLLTTYFACQKALKRKIVDCLAHV